MAGDKINAKGMQVIDSNNKTTLLIDENGNVAIDVTALRVQGKNVGEYLEENNNLLLNPISLSTDYWKCSYGTLTRNQTDPNGGTNAVRMDPNSGSTNEAVFYILPSAKPIKSENTTYVFSVWLKASGNSSYVYLGVNGTKIGSYITVSNVWQRYMVEAKVRTVGANYIPVYITLHKNSPSSVYIYNPCLEYADPFMSQADIMNQLTGGDSANQGIYLENGKVYINGNFIQSLLINAEMIRAGGLYSIGATIGAFKINANSIYSEDPENDFKSIEIVNDEYTYEGEPARRGTIRLKDREENYGFILRGDYIRSTQGRNVLELVPEAGVEDLSGDACHRLGYTRFTSEAEIRGAAKVYGKKSAVRETEHYGEQTLYCYETPNPMFGDIGNAVLDNTGICYVAIDDVLKETATTTISYFVFLQKCGDGDCWVEERHPEYFVVKGTPGLMFTWEVKVKQTGYEYIRFNDGEDETRRADFKMPNYEKQFSQEMENSIAEMEEEIYGGH